MHLKLFLTLLKINECVCDAWLSDRRWVGNGNDFLSDAIQHSPRISFVHRVLVTDVTGRHACETILLSLNNLAVLWNFIFVFRTHGYWLISY